MIKSTYRQRESRLREAFSCVKKLCCIKIYDTIEMRPGHVTGFYFGGRFCRAIDTGENTSGRPKNLNIPVPSITLSSFSFLVFFERHAKKRRNLFFFFCSILHVHKQVISSFRIARVKKKIRKNFLAYF